MHECDLSLRMPNARPDREQKIDCIPARDCCGQIKLAMSVELPPLTEALVSRKASKGSKYLGTPQAVLLPTDNSCCYSEHGLVTPDSDDEFVICTMHPISRGPDWGRVSCDILKIGQCSVSATFQVNLPLFTRLSYAQYVTASTDGHLVP